MTALSEHVAIGLIIRGCPDPEGASLIAPVLWVNRDVQTISNPINGLVGCNIRGRLKSGADGVDGFAHQVNLQNLLSSGGQIKCKLKDKPKTTTRRDLGQLFAVDPANYVTRRWQVKTSTAYLGKTDTTFDLVGPQPSVNNVLWIESEAVQVTAVTPLVVSGNSCTVTVTRGVLGSRARRHNIRPSKYPGNSDGSDFGLFATDRADFDKYDFEAELYYFTLENNTATYVEFWPRMTEGRPVAEGAESQGQEWTFTTSDVIGYLAKRKKSKRSSIKLTNAIQIKNFATPGYVEFPPTVPSGFAVDVPGNNPPGSIDVWLTCYEAERFFDFRFRLPFSEIVDSNAVDELSADIAAYPTAATRRCIPELVLNVGGYDWTFRVTELEFQASGPSWNYALDRQYILVHATLWDFIQESGQQASVIDKPCPGYPKQFQQTLTVDLSNLFVGAGAFAPGYTVGQGQVMAPKRNPSLNMGWSLQPADPIRRSLGEEPPEMRLRFILDKVKPVEQLLMLLLSGNGGGENDADYDLICTNLCPEIDRAFLNLGTASATPVTNDGRTSELLKLNQLLTFLEVVPIDVDTFDLGAALKRVLRLNSLITSYVAGGLTFRQLSGLFSSVGTIKQVTGVGRLVANGTQRVPAMKSLTVQGGHHPLKLKPGWQQPIYLFDGGDIEQGEIIDVYPVGGAVSPAQWVSGPMAQLIRVTFLMQRGSPPVYKVPTKRQRGAVYVGDLVSWSADDVVGPNGRGAQATRLNRWVVVGRDVNPYSGDQQLFLMEDTIGNILTYDGNLSPAWLVSKIGQNGAGNWCFLIKRLSESYKLDPPDALTSLYENGGYVRILCEDLHNPGASVLGSRPGYLETYGQLATYVTYGGWSGDESYAMVEVIIDPSWISNGFDPALMIEGRTYMTLADFRPRNTNPEGAEITPEVAYGVGGAIIAAGDGFSGSQPWGSALSVFDT